MKLLPFTQGAFYVATGLWPIVHLPSFEAVTGKKRDTWLVQTVGGLLAAVGGALLVGAFEERRSRSLVTLGVTAATVLATADVYFTAKGRISPIYLADAVVEAAMIAAWRMW